MGGMMEIANLPLESAAEVRSEPRRDARGWFARLFCQSELSELLAGRLPLDNVRLPDEPEAKAV